MIGNPSLTLLCIRLLQRIGRLRSNNCLSLLGGKPRECGGESVSPERLQQIQGEILAATLPNLREACRRRGLQDRWRRSSNSRGLLRSEAQARAGEGGRTPHLDDNASLFE